MPAASQKPKHDTQPFDAISAMAKAREMLRHVEASLTADLKLKEKSIATYTEVLDKIAYVDDPEARRTYALIQHDIVRTLRGLNRIDEALALSISLSRRFNNRDEETPYVISSFAYLNAGQCLSTLGRYEEALPFFDQAIERVKDIYSTDAIQIVGISSWCKSDIFIELDRKNDAIALCQQMHERYPDSIDEVNKWVHPALTHAFKLQESLGQHREASLTLRVIADRCDALASKKRVFRQVSKGGNFVEIDDIGRLENNYTSKNNEDRLNESQKLLMERIKDRPDLATACLQFLDKAVTRPEYAKLSAELTEDRLARRREQERQKKARYRLKRGSVSTRNSPATP